MTDPGARGEPEPSVPEHPSGARRSAIPLYHQIYLTLRDEILSGQRRCGTLLPTEMELCATLGVSRITARRALGELEASHLVERRRRLGTRVTYSGASKTIEAGVDQAVDALVAFGRDTEAEVLSIAWMPADDFVAQHLRLPAGELIVRAVRLRRLDGDPLGLVTSFAREELAGLMTPENLSTTPVLELLRCTGFPISAATQKVMATLASPDLSARLEIEPRAAILRVQRLISGADARPILLTIAEYRADRYQVVIDLVADRNDLSSQVRAPDR